MALEGTEPLWKEEKVTSEEVSSYYISKACTYAFSLSDYDADNEVFKVVAKSRIAEDTKNYQLRIPIGIAQAFKENCSNLDTGERKIKSTVDFINGKITERLYADYDSVHYPLEEN